MNNPTIFKLAAYGRMFLPLYFQPNGGTAMEFVQMKVDTGADFTTMSKENLYTLGYDYAWIKTNAFTGDEYNISTAAGDTEVVGILQIPLINLLGYEATHWPFRIIMDERRDFRNLLGRDLLAGFDYTFRNSANQFEIIRTSNFKPLYAFMQGQSIHEAHN